MIAAYRARGLVLRRHLRIEGWSSLLLRMTRMELNRESRSIGLSAMLVIGRAITPVLLVARRA